MSGLRVNDEASNRQVHKLSMKNKDFIRVAEREKTSASVHA